MHFKKKWHPNVIIQGTAPIFRHSAQKDADNQHIIETDKTSNKIGTLTLLVTILSSWYSYSVNDCAFTI